MVQKSKSTLLDHFFNGGGITQRTVIMKFMTSNFFRAMFYKRSDTSYVLVEELLFCSNDNDYQELLEEKRKEFESCYKCVIQFVEVWRYEDNTLSVLSLDRVIVDSSKKLYV